MLAAAHTHPTSPRDHARHLGPLNLATALLRSGFMPFLALFLHGRGLNASSVGAVIAFGGVVGLAATLPLAALVDHARSRPILLLSAGMLALGAPLVLLQAHGMAGLMCAVAMMSLSEAVVAPAVLAITLTSVPPEALLEQLGRNQAFGHAGRAAGLLLSGVIGSHFGFPALIAFEAVYLMVFLLLIARTSPVPALGLGAPCVPLRAGEALLLLGVTLGLFQLGNAALPILLGLSVVDTSRIDAPLLASGSAMIAQVAMIAGSLLAIPALRKWGYWRVLAATFSVLPLRCALAAILPGSAALIPVELLHGFAEGFQLVTIGAVIGDLRMPGRAGIRYGSIMLIQGVGTAASPLLGGYVADHWAGLAAYSMLGAIGILALGFWIACRPYLAGLTSVRRLRLV